jgi:hypothetical protein
MGDADSTFMRRVWMRMCTLKAGPVAACMYACQEEGPGLVACQHKPAISEAAGKFWLSAVVLCHCCSLAWQQHITKDAQMQATQAQQNNGEASTYKATKEADLKLPAALVQSLNADPCRCR